MGSEAIGRSPTRCLAAEAAQTRRRRARTDSGAKTVAIATAQIRERSTGRPDEGRASVGGYDVVEQAHQVRQLIGLTGQYASVDELTGTENLVLIARLLGVPPGRPRPCGSWPPC